MNHPFFGNSSGAATRPAPKPYKPWEPDSHQLSGVAFLMQNAASALFWDPGLGKTSAVLAAFAKLQEAGAVETMLVVAPLRVCQLVWRQEARKWEQFRHLKFALLHGRDKEQRLHEPADVYLINPEGIAWLASQFQGSIPLPFDVVCIDELTKFKNYKAKRCKQLRRKLGAARYRWGLTGTPASNGYLDLFGQFLLLDDGVALGKHFTYYRDKYFEPDWSGFKWNLRKGCEERINERLAPYVHRLSADDRLNLPPIRDNLIVVDLPPAARRQYEELKKEAILALPGGVVTAANSGAVYGKLKQLANGAVYLTDEQGERRYEEIHRAKLDAVEDLVEELSGQPLIIAYEFQHDLERLRGLLGDDVPTLSGVTGKRAAEIEAAWNRGELPILLLHPASAGHGLNLQAAAGEGVAHICWFSLPPDLEYYDQTIRRLKRRGSEASHVMNHIILMKGGIDEQVTLPALAGKERVQQAFLRSFNEEILRDSPAPHAAGNAADEEEAHMVKRLGYQSDGQTATTPAPSGARRVVPKGWGAATEDEDLPPTGAAGEGEEEGEEEQPAAPAGKVAPKGWGAAAPAPAANEQREAIRSKISAPPVEEDEEESESAAALAMQAFGSGIAQQLGGGDEEGEEEQAETPTEPEKPKRTRRAKAEKAPEPETSAAEPDETEQNLAKLEKAGRLAAESDYAVGANLAAQRAALVGAAGVEAERARMEMYAAEQHARPSGRIVVEYSGVPREGLAAFFAALAEQFSNGQG